MEHLAHVPTTTAEATELLRESVVGGVFTPGQPGYGAARTVGPAPVASPHVVVVAETTQDIVQAVRYARAEHRSVAIRASGRRIGLAADDAVLINTTQLDTVAVDPVLRTATVSAGATWQQVADAAARHRLAPVMGESPTRCAVSDVLMGGLGWQARRHGFASDHMVAAELVTPDGLIVEVSADSQPELFWALRSAGAGTVGVVTRIELELQPITPVLAGVVAYPIAMASEVFERWRAWVTGVRPELTSSVVLAGDSIAVHGCWSGALDTGASLVGKWGAWRAPLIDTWTVHDSSAVTVTDPRLDHPRTLTSDWTNTLRDELLAGLVTAADDAIVELRHLGGAVRSRAGSSATARGRRDQFLISLANYPGEAVVARGPLAPHVTGAVMLDRCHAAERALRIRDAFDDADWDRVQAVKNALDPTNRFRHGLATS